MTCPECGGVSGVSYTISDCDGVYRRRKCKECNYIFYTTESDSDGSDLLRLEKLNREERKKHNKNYNKNTKKFKIF